MNLTKRYKTTVAVCLLALYAFIATPVSYWHQHKANCEKNDIEQHSQVVKTSNALLDANCNICSHHYSVAANDAVTVYFVPITFFNTFIDFYILKKIANPGYGQSNKGPPAVA